MTSPRSARLRSALWLVLATSLALACALRGRGADAQQQPAPLDDNPDDGTEPGAFDAGVDASPAVRVVPLVSDTDAAVARGRGVLLTAGELLRVVGEAPEPAQRRWAADPRGLDEVLDGLLADRLLVEEARRRGLESDPAVRAALERALVSRLRATAIAPLAGDPMQVTADEVQRFYDAHPERFHIPERRRAWVLFVTDRRTADEALRAALPPPARRGRRGRSSRPRGPTFRELAARFNTDPELLRTDGELVDVTREQPDLDERLREALFALERPGEVHPSLVPGVWRGQRGYFVVRLGTRRAPIERTVEQSAEWIRRRIVLERRVQAERALVERLAQEAGVNRTPAERVLRLEVVDAGAAGPADASVAGPRRP